MIVLVLQAFLVALFVVLAVGLHIWLIWAICISYGRPDEWRSISGSNYQSAEYEYEEDVSDEKVRQTLGEHYLN